MLTKLLLSQQQERQREPSEDDTSMVATSKETTSIAGRIKRRKRRWCQEWRRQTDEGSTKATTTTTTTTTTTRPTIEQPPRSRRRLGVEKDWKPKDEESKLERATCIQNQRNMDLELIKEKLGNYKHHGTGNPLLVRSPTTPKDLAVRNLAGVIKNGVIVGLPTTNSTPKLKTEVGKNGESFWTKRVCLAGSYGWTGLILPEDTDSSKPFPVEHALWILVQDSREYDNLKSLLLESDHGDKWETTMRKVVTISQLADQLRLREK